VQVGAACDDGCNGVGGCGVWRWVLRCWWARRVALGAAVLLGAVCDSGCGAVGRCDVCRLYNGVRRCRCDVCRSVSLGRVLW
jgi:hypothetical protein